MSVDALTDIGLQEGAEVRFRPRPNANRGDNVTGASPYQDTDPAQQANQPSL